MLLPDVATMQAYTLWIAVVAAVLAVASVLLGLFSFVTGRDHWPKPMRRVRWRTPASYEDQRRHGTGMMLTGGAMLLVLLGVSMNALSAQDHSLREPLITLQFLLTTIGAATSLALMVGAYVVNLDVRYMDRRISAGTAPGEPTT